ncbi:hypothetical protein GGX14DRAFT_387931 [Mycena pura]|uniref:Uncharacterized protein n=1 Tax=Mycena pura TaxID=153505 RepID=A0AAD6VT41_9AGAR|nr:hypothetical protein GGX14DRAFT_387931 [Mycena pura]
MDLQVHPKVLAAPPKNLNTGNTEIAWFWIKDCSDKRGKQIKICDTSEMEALDTKKPHAKFQAGSMALSCNTRLASLNYSEKQQYLLQCAAMENLTIRYRERWKIVVRVSSKISIIRMFVDQDDSRTHPLSTMVSLIHRLFDPPTSCPLLTWGGNGTSIRRPSARGNSALWERCLGVIARRWGWGTRLPRVTCDLYADYCGGTTLHERYTGVDANGAGQVLTAKICLSRFSTWHAHACNMHALNDGNQKLGHPEFVAGSIQFRTSAPNLLL